MPLLKWMAILVGWGAVVAVLMWFAEEIVDRDSPAGRKGALAGAIVTTVASVFGLVPVAMLRRLGSGWADFGWMAALPFRFGLTLAGWAALVKLVDVPATPTTISTIVTYLALLVVETTLMYRFVQSADRFVQSDGSSSQRRSAQEISEKHS